MADRKTKKIRNLRQLRIEKRRLNLLADEIKYDAERSYKYLKADAKPAALMSMALGAAVPKLLGGKSKKSSSIAQSKSEPSWMTQLIQWLPMLFGLLKSFAKKKRSYHNTLEDDNYYN